MSDGVHLKALSIRQPWASLILAGVKQYETRSWSTTYRGPLLIHAGKAVPDRNGRAMGYVFSPATLPLGGVLGVAVLVDVVPTESITRLSKTERALGNFARGRFAWRMRVASPSDFARASGQLGIFEIESTLLTRTDAGRRIVLSYLSEIRG